MLRRGMQAVPGSQPNCHGKGRGGGADAAATWAITSQPTVQVASMDLVPWCVLARNRCRSFAATGGRGTGACSFGALRATTERGVDGMGTRWRSGASGACALAEALHDAAVAGPASGAGGSGGVFAATPPAAVVGSAGCGAAVSLAAAMASFHGARASASAGNTARSDARRQ